MEREEMLARLKTLLEESGEFAVVEDGMLFGRVPTLHVVTKQHEEFIVRVEEV